ncbi:MAG: flagellar assembly protein FliW, partial [Deltaproteobacteria bacterium]|nr:flagellar assembly protein FliW [Deltaproteobacteria bacterium]
MKISTSRFGAVDVDDAEVIRFPRGIIGFPSETTFVLIPHGEEGLVAWLQSTASAEVAFPVVSAHALPVEFPDVPLDELADRAGLGRGGEDLALLAVLCALPGQPATVNLLAPIVVNAATRVGAQVFLEGSRFTTQELLAVPRRALSAR